MNKLDICGALVSKTIKKSHTEHETKETNITDSIISSYGVGPTDDKGRPLFGLQALRRPKGKPDTETDGYLPKEPNSPVDIRDSSGRAFFGLKALRAPKRDPDYPDSPTTKDTYRKHSIDSPRQGSPTTGDYDDGEVNRLMSEPGQSLKDMIRKHERLMDDDEDERRPGDKMTSYSTSTVIRSSAIRRPDGIVSVRKNVVRGETTAKDDEEPQTRVTTEEYSYETPENLDADEPYGRKSIRNITSRSSTSDSIQDRSRTTRRSVSPERRSPDRHPPLSSSRPSSRTSIGDYPDPKSPTCRKSISDRLTQLSKKFSNDSLDRNLDVREVTTDSHHSTYTRTTSTHRSSIDGSTSPLNDTPRYGQENGKPDRRFSSTLRDNENGYRRGSSTPIEDVKETLYRKFSGSEDIEHTVPSFTRVGKGGSVKALSQKFQQAAAEAETPKTGVSSYPKAGLILRSTSFKQTNGELTPSDSPGLKQSISMEVRVGSPTRSGGTHTSHTDYPTDRSWSPSRGDTCDRRVITQTTTEIRSDGGRSFLGNSSKVTGVQDILNRMRAADQENDSDDTANDSEARSLLNKFLGASVMMTGMEPLVKASGATSSTLVSQAERQRILDSPSRNGYKVRQHDDIRSNDDPPLLWSLPNCRLYGVVSSPTCPLASQDLR
ncbi:hypothetical protein RUM44_008414 [Polyplax serrata]|uniref:Uncharacterized protein n=1 Tax=Polyplax serrata TaxID=468196 RepID=A0ABR1BCN4_POLSC